MIIDEVGALEAAIAAGGLVEHRDMRLDAHILDQPGQVGSRAIGGVGHEAFAVTRGTPRPWGLEDLQPAELVVTLRAIGEVWRVPLDGGPPRVVARGQAELADRIGSALLQGWAGMVDAHDRTAPLAVAMERAQAPPAADLDPVARLHGAAEAVDRLAHALERPESVWLGAAAGELDATLEGLLAEVRDVAAAWGPPLDPVRLSAQLRAIALERQAAERERRHANELKDLAAALQQVESAISRSTAAVPP